VACAAQLTLDGRAYGAHLSVAPALLSVSASGVPSSVLQGVVPDWAQAAPCEVSVTLARGALDAGALAALEPGDVLIPCEVWADAGAWSEARLYCDAFTEPLATLCVQADAGAGGGLLARGPAPRAVAPRAPSDGVVAFSVDAARASVPLSDLSRWLAEERVPLPVDPAAPLTLFVAGQPVARGHLVRDQGDVGLCIERTLRPLQSSAGSPNTAA
jgi:flagellar motor switch/type III secretory pathway protein FliN